MSKPLETTLEINLGALSHNFNYLKSRLQNKAKFLAVVKAFAYGSDAITIARHLETQAVDYFAVAYTNEGILLRNAGITTPILVLHPQPANFEALINHCLEPSIYSSKVLQSFIKTATKLKQQNYPVHIKFNTGLNRLGFGETELDFVIAKLKSTAVITAKSVFSHLAASEDLNELEFTSHQIERFTIIAKTFEKHMGYKPWLHLCNTSGMLNFPEAHFDMVRCGIGLYGFGNSAKEDKNLKPIAALKSVISQIHTIAPGETVGYNRAYTATSDEKTATIPLGHADGLTRQYGNHKGCVWIKDQRAPIIGNVCMDMIMVNVTGIDCAEGDEVVIFDAAKKASDLADSVNTISYEILTAVSQRVKRQVIY